MKPEIVFPCSSSLPYFGYPLYLLLLSSSFSCKWMKCWNSIHLLVFFFCSINQSSFSFVQFNSVISLYLRSSWQIQKFIITNCRFIIFPIAVPLHLLHYPLRLFLFYFTNLYSGSIGMMHQNFLLLEEINVSRDCINTWNSIVCMYCTLLVYLFRLRLTTIVWRYSPSPWLYLFQPILDKLGLFCCYPLHFPLGKWSIEIYILPMFLSFPTTLARL